MCEHICGFSGYGFACPQGNSNYCVPGCQKCPKNLTEDGFGKCVDPYSLCECVHNGSYIQVRLICTSTF